MSIHNNATQAHWHALRRCGTFTAHAPHLLHLCATVHARHLLTSLCTTHGTFLHPHAPRAAPCIPLHRTHHAVHPLTSAHSSSTSHHPHHVAHATHPTPHTHKFPTASHHLHIADTVTHTPSPPLCAITSSSHREMMHLHLNCPQTSRTKG